MAMGIAGAFFMLASASTDAAVHDADYNDHEKYQAESAASGIADTVFSALAGVATAAAVYRLSDSDNVFEYYPLSTNISGAGLTFSDRLSMQRGGFRFQLSAISRSKTAAFGPAADFRKDARKMANVVPGYPQPARIVIGVKINY